MSDLKPVFDYIDAHVDDYLERLASLVEIPSVTGEIPPIRECAFKLNDILNELGFESCVMEGRGESPFVVAQMSDAGENAKTLMIHGHYDVKPGGEPELWRTKQPFKVTICDGILYGRGVSDDKGQILANIMGVAAYHDTVGKLPMNIKLFFEGEEELGSKNLGAFIEEHKELLKADVMFGSDVHMHEDNIPTVYLGNKGFVRVRIEVDTHAPVVHAQSAPVMLDPGWLLIDILKDIADRDGNVKLEGFFDDMLPITQEETDAIEKIPFHKLDGLNPRYNNKESYYRHFIMDPTASVVGMTCGTVVEQQYVVNNKAVALVGFHLVPDQKKDVAYECVKRLIKEKKLEDYVTVSSVSQNTGTRLSITDRYVKAFKLGLEDVYGQEPLIIPNCASSNPGSRFLDNLGIVFILVPFALATENAHTYDENIPIECAVKGQKATAAIIKRLAEIKE